MEKLVGERTGDTWDDDGPRGYKPYRDLGYLRGIDISIRHRCHTAPSLLHFLFASMSTSIPKHVCRE